jgi:hypothetical protein
MEKYDNIKLPDNLDELTMRAIEKGDRYKRKAKFSIRKMTTAASIALVIIIGMSTVTFAAKFSYDYISSIFTIVKDAVGMRGDSGEAVGINKTVSNKGISITVQEVICDDYGVYVSYIIKSRKPFVNPKDNYIMISEDSTVSFSNIKLAGGSFEGKFIDENTFIGVGTYIFDNIKEKIPENFTFNVNINTVKLNGVEDGKGNIIRGNWNFSMPITVNKSGVKEIVPGKQNDIDVKKVSLSKFHSRFEAEIPKEWIPKYIKNKYINIETNDGRDIRPVKFSLDEKNGKGLLIFWSRGVPEDASSLIYDFGNIGKVKVDIK